MSDPKKKKRKPEDESEEVSSSETTEGTEKKPRRKKVVLPPRAKSNRNEGKPPPVYAEDISVPVVSVASSCTSLSDNWKQGSDHVWNEAVINKAYADYCEKKANPTPKEKWKKSYDMKVKGLLAESQADLWLKQNGYKKLDKDAQMTSFSGAPRGTGFDGVWAKVTGIDKDGKEILDIYIIESKYDRSPIGVNDDGIVQMTDDWVRKNIDKVPQAHQKAVQDNLARGEQKKLLIRVLPDGSVDPKDVTAWDEDKFRQYNADLAAEGRKAKKQKTHST